MHMGYEWHIPFLHTSIRFLKLGPKTQSDVPPCHAI